MANDSNRFRFREVGRNVNRKEMDVFVLSALKTNSWLVVGRRRERKCAKWIETGMEKDKETDCVRDRAESEPKMSSAQKRLPPKGGQMEFVWVNWRQLFYQTISRHPNFWLSALGRWAAFWACGCQPSLFPPTALTWCLRIRAAHMSRTASNLLNANASERKTENWDGIGYVMHSNFHYSIHFNCALNGNQFPVLAILAGGRKNRAQSRSDCGDWLARDDGDSSKIDKHSAQMLVYSELRGAIAVIPFTLPHHGIKSKRHATKLLPCPFSKKKMICIKEMWWCSWELFIL